MKWICFLAVALVCSCAPVPPININIYGSNDSVTVPTMTAFSLTATIPLAGAP